MIEKKIFLTNTRTHKKEEFRTLTPGEVKMYSCGPTVYGPAHIGASSRTRRLEREGSTKGLKNSGMIAGAAIDGIAVSPTMANGIPSNSVRSRRVFVLLVCISRSTHSHRLFTSLNTPVGASSSNNAGNISMSVSRARGRATTPSAQVMSLVAPPKLNPSARTPRPMISIRAVRFSRPNPSVLLVVSLIQLPICIAAFSAGEPATV
ncbi:MAG: hypothetical protein EBU84_06370, partial [Actinobacteria bacterium]|nr:hypothetical protein [Actinomycetota bacterium]